MKTFEEILLDIDFLHSLEYAHDWTLVRLVDYEPFFYKHNNEEEICLSKLSSGTYSVSVSLAD